MTTFKQHYVMKNHTYLLKCHISHLFQWDITLFFLPDSIFYRKANKKTYTQQLENENSCSLFARLHSFSPCLTVIPNLSPCLKVGEVFWKCEVDSHNFSYLDAVTHITISVSLC